MLPSKVTRICPALLMAGIVMGHCHGSLSSFWSSAVVVVAVTIGHGRVIVVVVCGAMRGEGSFDKLWSVLGDQDWPEPKSSQHGCCGRRHCRQRVVLIIVVVGRSSSAGWVVADGP